MMRPDISFLAVAPGLVADSVALACTPKVIEDFERRILDFFVTR
jgi:hypothetical protein